MDDKEHTIDLVEDRRASIVEASNEAKELSIWQTVKLNPKVIMASVAMTIGPLIYGFDNIIVGLVTAMPAFQYGLARQKQGQVADKHYRASFGSKYNGTLILPALWLALWNALLQVGAMIGSLINGPVADRWGRRIAFMTGGAIACIGTSVFVALECEADSL